MYQCCDFGGECRECVLRVVLYVVYEISKGIVGSSYVMVSAAKWAITCVSGKWSNMWGKFWYQLMSGITSIVMVFGSFFAASLAQCIACWVVSSLCGWAYPIPFHLYWKACAE